MPPLSSSMLLLSMPQAQIIMKEEEPNKDTVDVDDRLLEASSAMSFESSASTSTLPTVVTTSTLIDNDNDDPTTTHGITALERQKALRLKRAAQADAQINDDKISDLEFLQYAIVAMCDGSSSNGEKRKTKKKHGGLKEALVRIKRMQKFKEGCGIQLDGSYAQAMRDVQAFTTLHPHFFLALGALDNGTHILSAQWSCFRAHAMHTDEAHSVRLRGLFYYFQACQPNIAAMRAGYISLADCHGMSWRNFSLTAQRRSAQLYSMAYPIRFQRAVLMEASAVIVWCYNLCKALGLYSAKLISRICFADSIRTHVQTQGYPAHVLPTDWGGTLDPDDFGFTVGQKLQERYALEATFRLE